MGVSRLESVDVRAKAAHETIRKSAALDAAWFGRVEYGRAWDLQRELFLSRLEHERNDCLVLLEHPPTYTLGKRARPEDVVYDAAERALRGISMYEVDRGGRATYHGPGQLVGYPIMALGERYDVLRYLRGIEEVLIRTARDLGVDAHRDEHHTGVWVGTNKLGAIGVKVTRGITMHGFAFNVAPDLSMFEGIVPCGLQGRWVTSVLAESGRLVAVDHVGRLAAGHFAAVFRKALVWMDADELMANESLVGAE